MVDQLSLPTDTIEGIGPRIAAMLQAADIHTVADLLRVGPADVHSAVARQTSFEVARSWCHMAALLQIAHVTPQRAEVLVRAGVVGSGDLGYRSLEQLRSMFLDGQSSPSDSQLFEMVKDAMVISNRGCVSGTVLDPDGQPLSGAMVAVGSQQAATDARGRFRVIRVAWWAETSLLVRHVNYPFAQFAISRILREGTPYERTFQLAEASPPTEFMEVRGERLPLMGDARPVPRHVDRTDFLRRDILTVVERSADGERVKLVSKLLVWADGRLEARYAWFPAAELSSVRLGDCYVVGPDRLRPIVMNARRLRTWIGFLRARREAGPRPGDVNDLGQWLGRLPAVMEEGSVSGERRF
jgi:hypothetical protein